MSLGDVVSVAFEIVVNWRTRRSARGENWSAFLTWWISAVSTRRMSVYVGSGASPDKWAVNKGDIIDAVAVWSVCDTD
jgi:hypothetical protein